MEPGQAPQVATLGQALRSIRNRVDYNVYLGTVSVIVMLVTPRGIAGLAWDRLGWTLFLVTRKPPR